MTGLDTNVLVRYIVRDDAAQAQAAARFLREHCTPESPGWVNRVVCCELVWVLQRSYGYSREQIGEVLERLLRTRQLSVEDLPAAWKALAAYRSSKGDFADALLAATNRESGCTETVTFDRTAGSLDGMRLLKA
jgi:predicted nucleic-acid-binding protein